MLKRWMAMVSLIAVVGLTAWYGMPGKQARLEIDKPSLPFVLPDLAGKMQSLAEGEVILLNFWATWCPPCRQEMPSMASLYNRFKDKGFNVVAISVDRDANGLAGFVREYQLPFQILHDKGSEVSHLYGVFRYPESFLIDRNGIVRHHLVGAVEWMTPEIISEIEALLAEPVQG